MIIANSLFSRACAREARPIKGCFRTITRTRAKVGIESPGGIQSLRLLSASTALTYFARIHN